MTALPARALAADKRWADVAAAPTRAPGAGAVGTAAEPTKLPTQRDSFAWGNKPVPPASNAWGSSSLLSFKNDEGSGLLTNVTVRPASGGSSGSSTSGSDLLDSPLAWGQNSNPFSASDVLTLHSSATAISHPQRTDSRSGSMQISFSEALKAPLRSNAKWGTTSHGRSSLGQPTLGSGNVTTQHEQRKNLVAGGDPVPNTNLPVISQAQNSQSHGTHAPSICIPPPWLDYWNSPPDHPPDRNRMWLREAASYGAHKPGNTPGTGSSPVESLIPDGQTPLHSEGEAKHGPVRGGCHPENRDSCYAYEPTDACVKSLPHLIPGKVKDSHSVTIEKQPVIKKDLVLLEKIRLLNVRSRNRHARNMSEISSCRESKAEHPKSIDVKTDQVAKDIPFHAVTHDITASFDLANRVSECRNMVLNGSSNVPADCVIVDMSEGHATESGENRKLGESADCHVQKAKSVAKPEEVKSHKSYNAPIEANKISERDTSTSDKGFIDYGENLNVPLIANAVKNAAVSISSTPLSNSEGVTRGPLSHNVTPSDRKIDFNVVEHISQKTAAQSSVTIVQKLLPTESRQRQVHARDRILRERSNIAESSEHTRNVAGTLMDTRRSEDKDSWQRQVHSQDRILREVKNCSKDRTYQKCLRDSYGHCKIRGQG